jgi:hypothetical protein
MSRLTPRGALLGRDRRLSVAEKPAGVIDQTFQ